MSFKDTVKANRLSILSPTRMKVTSSVIIILEWREHLCQHHYTLSLRVRIKSYLNLLNTRTAWIGVKHYKIVVSRTITRMTVVA